MLVSAKVERNSTADKYHKVLISLNGAPTSAAQMKQFDPQKIQNKKVLHTKEDMQAYNEVELNAIILHSRVPTTASSTYQLPVSKQLFHWE